MTRGLLLASTLLALAACERNVAPARTPPAEHVAGAQGATVTPAQQAVLRAELARTDPATMTDAEVDRVLTSDALCRFSYSRGKAPIVVIGGSEGATGRRGVVKLHGALVALRTVTAVDAPPPRDGIHLVADGVDIAITPRGQRTDGDGVREADMIFRLRQGLEVGYRGFYECDDGAESAARS